MLITVLFYIFVVVTVVQVLIFIFFASFTFGFSNKLQLTSKLEPISIIVYVKNNDEKLIEWIPEVMKQDHPNFELVIANHYYYDKSSETIEYFAKKFSNIKLVFVENKENFWNNKKYALTLAIKAASHNNVLIADINSIPNSTHWIHEISKNFHSNKKIVLGYRKISSKKKSLSNYFIRYQNTLHAMINFSFAKSGRPFRSNEGNFAFTKEEFFRVNGFMSHIKVPFGENDLFLKDAGNKINTTFCWSPNSTITDRKPYQLSTFYVKHKALFLHYPLLHRLIITLFHFTKLLFYGLAIVLLPFHWQLVTVVFLIYYIFQYIFIGKAINTLKENSLLYFLPILDLGYILLLGIQFCWHKIIK